MTWLNEPEIRANLERARDSIRAASQLCAGGFYDFAAARAYYAAFYAATAALLTRDVLPGKHSGVIALTHQHLVKTGKLAEVQGKALNWLFELRAIADYGVMIHVSEQQARQAIAVAESFVGAIEHMLDINAE